ncbi:MAG: AsmA family protein [Geobacteraceae bacterium GWC2_58_44]|nr:MAG: AsmA family protein [Geobacteraceae bacterium GWC2_58_44]HBG05773.1 AsmA family protein [Geobacter sp.]
MQLRNKRAWILPLAATIVSVIVLGASLLPRFLDLDTYKEEIVAQVKSALKRDLQYQSAEFSLRYGLSFSFGGVAIKEKDGLGDLVTAERLTISIALVPLLRRELVLSRMHLVRPVLKLSRDRDGVFNVSDLFQATPGGGSPGIRGIELKKARVRFTDLALSETPLVTELSETDLYLSWLARGKDCDFKLSGELVSGAGRVPLLIAGVAKIPAAGQPLSSLELSGRVRTGPLDAAQFWPYYSRYVPFKSLSGALALEASFRGSLAGFQAKGDFEATRVNLDYPQVFHARLTPKSLKAAWELEFSGDSLDIGSLKLNLDGLSVQGSCRLSDIRSKDLRITAKATSNRFDLRSFRQYIPYGIIVDGTADFIEQKIMGGEFQLDQGRLDGRVSQILHMELGQNYNILSVRARVDEGVVAYGSGFPVFSGVKGVLELAGKDFNLKGMTGRFGTSPIALEGRIADYCMLTPSRYLFSANLNPRQQEALWLLGEKLTLSDGSSMRLKGEGTSSLYRLSGDWDLASSSYSFSDLIAKPKARPNTVGFDVTLDEKEYRFTTLNYHLAPLSLSATVTSGYDGPVSLELKSNQFQAAEIAPLVPVASRYQPSGRMQALLRASGPGLDRLSWGGNVALSGVSFKAGEKIKPVTGVNGSIRISGETLESSQLSVRLGSSTIYGRGTLSGFKAPSFSLSFTSPVLDLADLGFPQGRLPLRAEKVQGNLSYSKDNLQIGSLSGTLGKSVLQMKGSVKDLKQPVIELAITSPHLELDDLTPLFGASTGDGSRLTLKAQLSASEGKLQEIPFQNLNCLLLLDDKILYLQPFEFASLDGEVSGKMRMDFGSGTPRYQMNCDLQRVSAERLMHAMGVKKQELTGTLSLQGELSAKGESSAELRKSALGAVKLKVEHGSIRKFSTLSKIFSILNVSQLLKFRLPDMVSGGMPYNRITGDFAIKDGTASTENLYLDSNAINLSAVGKLDLLKNELDLNIGVRPLQTVDKVVSKIPIVGWILTGKDRSLITTYFEAKGPIEDPKVTAVPVKSLAKGVLNIFQRVFELPGRLITDTGEVIIGK